MKAETRLKIEEALTKRRQLLKAGTQVCLCSTIIPIIASCSGDDEEEINEEDIELLNEILDLEYKVIAAYDVGVDLGILNQSATDLAVQFQKDHLVHAEMLTAVIRQLKGRPNRSKKIHEYSFPKRKLVLPQDVLEFFAEFEKDLTKKYKEAVPTAVDKEVASSVASVLGVESQHWSLWRYWLGERPIPQSLIG